MKKHIKKKFKFTKKHGYIAGGVVAAIVVLLIVGFATGILPFVKNHADVKSFQLAHRYEITIQSDELVYDEENQCDNFVINFSIKNIREKTLSYDYDPNMPTADQITSEQESQMSEEEKDAINRNTIYKHANDVVGKVSTSNTLVVVAAQNGQDLTNAEGERKDGTSSNTDSLSKIIDYQATSDTTLMYRLDSTDDCTVVFSAMIDPEDPNKDEFGDSVYDIKEVHYSIAGLMSWGMRGQKEKEYDEIRQKESAEKVSFKGVEISLVDGWYADSEASAALKLKNKKYPDGLIEVSYSSSEDAQKLAMSTAAWTDPAPPVSTKEIGGTTFYYYEKPDGSFVLCANGKHGFAVRFAFDKVSFDDVQKFVETLDFSL